MLSPTKYNANVGPHVAYKTQRWALRLAEFKFKIEHIPEEQNNWADILTRWVAPGFSESRARRISMLKVPLITENLPELPSNHVKAVSQGKLLHLKAVDLF